MDIALFVHVGKDLLCLLLCHRMMTERQVLIDVLAVIECEILDLRLCHALRILLERHLADTGACGNVRTCADFYCIDKVYDVFGSLLA